MTTLSLLTEKLNLFSCPICSQDLEFDNQRIQCRNNHQFKTENNIPLLFAPNDWDGKSDVTDAIKNFYEKTPFPNYDDIDSKMRLIEKAEKGLFAHLLNQQLPHGIKILEVGCGTGQMSNFLGISAGRLVFGADMCLNSLGLAQEFKTKNDIHNTHFVQMNLFRPVFKPESFDLVISNGVLHHTSDPRGGCESILRLVKKGGYIIIGLYNTFGRLGTDLRRILFKMTGRNQSGFTSFDPHLKTSMSQSKWNAWFMDQYLNPHESKHTITEVMKWFDETGVEFIKSIPKPSLLDPFSEDEALFSPTKRGTMFDHLLVQWLQMLSGSKEGGLFIMIGRKKD